MGIILSAGDDVAGAVNILCWVNEDDGVAAGGYYIHRSPTPN